MELINDETQCADEYGKSILAIPKGKQVEIIIAIGHVRKKLLEIIDSDCNSAGYM